MIVPLQVQKRQLRQYVATHGIIGAPMAQLKDRYRQQCQEVKYIIAPVCDGLFLILTTAVIRTIDLLLGRNRVAVIELPACTDFIIYVATGGFVGLEGYILNITAISTLRFTSEEDAVLSHFQLLALGLASV